MYPREYFDTYWRPEIRDQVFVAMSFADEFTAAWADIIRPAIEENLEDMGLTPHRVDVTKIGGSIITEIMDGIAHARLVLGEISTMSNGNRNPNVMYEVGLAHALRQPEEVVLIRRDDTRINFDIASIRVHRYWSDDAPKSRQLIADTIRECIREVDLRKGLKTQQAIESLNDKCLELIEEFHKQPSFAFRRQQTMGDILSGVPINVAVLKLLELGIVRTDADMRQHVYSYRWTPFGRTVIRRLGFEAR